MKSLYDLEYIAIDLNIAYKIQRETWSDDQIMMPYMIKL